MPQKTNRRKHPVLLKKFIAICRLISCLLLLFVLNVAAFGQNGRTVTGTVTGDKNEPLSGVTITEKGTGNATSSAEDGTYSIRLTKGNAILVYSYVGFASQEIKVENASEFAVKMSPKASEVQEVIVVGYGTQKKSDVTGAVASVPKERFTQVPVTNVMQAIQGSVAGVRVTTNSQVPGRTANVQIRGVNSISANSSPLYIIDGIPLAPDGSTNDINAADILSMEILKDASAVAIYGVRGSNGVVLITTKRGATGKPQIRYNMYTGVENIIESLTPSSPERYAQKWADYKKQNNLTDTSILPNLYERNTYYGASPYGSKSTDWMDVVTQTGVITDHNLSVSGGTKDARYYISGEYLKQKGSVPGYQYHRVNLRANLDLNVTDYLTIGTSAFFNNNNYDGGRANFYLGMIASPYGQLYDANGNYSIYPMYPELLYTNPMLGTTADRIDRSKNLTGSGYLEFKPRVVPGLKYRLNTSYSVVDGRNAYYNGRSVNDLLGTASIFNSHSTYWIIENILTYTKDINQHHFDVTALYSSQKKIYENETAGATGFINDQLSFYNLGAGATQSSGSFKDEKTNLSQMGRINYSFASRYLLTLTARRDGSSVFGSNTNKYGVFPSAAIGWNLAKEGFMQDIKAIKELKLRASYGKTGNEAIAINGTQTTSSTYRTPINGISTIGVLANNLGNADLHWEETTGLNVGVDFGVLKNRIRGTVDAFWTHTDDILLSRNLPIITGYSSVLDNLGKTENRGLEVTLNTVNIEAGDFRWETSLNFTKYTNKLVSLYGNKDANGNEISDIGNRWFIGEPLGVVYDYVLQGVWQVGEDASSVDPSAKPGFLKFKDVNGDKKIDANDRVVLGSTQPKWLGGMTNTFHYKNFHLSLFIQSSQGGLRNNTNLTFADEAGRMNIPSQIDYWTESNPINDRPSLSALAVTGTRGYGYPKDPSYTRIKDATLSYTFPNSLLDKIKLASLTLYISGRNLYTFTDWQGWDPEQDFTFRGSGDWVNNYPPVRSFTFGANIALR